MPKKIIITLLTFCMLIGCVSAIDSSDWKTADVGYETFKIPPEYENPESSDFNMYEYAYDIDEFTIRYINPNIMDLYGYFTETYGHMEKVKVAGHDAVHFTTYDRHDNANNSKLWFSAGEEFYYIAWRGEKITPEIKEIVKSASPSSYSHDEFYSILKEEYDNYKLIKTIESQNYQSGSYGDDRSHHSFISVGSNGINFGVMN